MLIAHASDFHVFSTERETSLVRLDAVERARRVVEDIAAFMPSIEAVMLTGDLTDGGTVENYALLKNILKPLRVPVFVVPGNHDRRGPLMKAFSHLPFDDPEFAQYDVSLGELRILALDTLIEGRGNGQLCDKRLDWLERKLSKPHGGHTAVLMHHPPFPSGMDALDRMCLSSGSARLAQLLKTCGGRVRILSGHIHRPYQSWWNGVFCAVGGSPAFQVGLELGAADAEPSLANEPYAWFVHNVSPGDGFAVHPRYVSF